MAFEIEYEPDCYCRRCRKGFTTRQGYEQHVKDKHERAANNPSAADEEIDRAISGRGRLWGTP